MIPVLWSLRQEQFKARTHEKPLSEKYSETLHFNGASHIKPCRGETESFLFVGETWVVSKPFLNGHQISDNVLGAEGKLSNTVPAHKEFIL